MVFDDCPICLDEMLVADHNHPLQCERRCGYNFCKNCIESLITSSKDEYIEASDGNCHVKVFLHCPNCRSELSHTIRDTLLLRKADSYYLNMLTQSQSQLQDDNDDYIKKSSLTASQLQLKEAMEKPEVLAAIQTAREMEAIYLGKDLLGDSMGTLSNNTSADSTETAQAPTIEEADYEEEGVEADLVRGVHQSFRWPKAPPPKLKPIVKTQVDPSLFAGLDYFLSDIERSDVTELMTSGKPSQLAEAAQILTTVAEISKDPTAKVKPTTTKASHKLARKSSVIALIAEAQEAHDHHDSVSSINSNNTMKTTKAFSRSRPQSEKARAHRKLDRDLLKQAQFQKFFPIPVRMPKCITIDFVQQPVFDLHFIDDEWNGTVMDAYSKISIGYTGAVTQKRTSNRGVRTVLGVMGDDSDVRIALEGQKRVLVARAGRESGQQGAMKGDVVTHVAGEQVAGKTAAELFMLINAERQMRKKTVIITLNAEQSVAEALKRRAMAIAESY
mmetsp:Transcript_3390/g.5577  ORF Transcript_3390/g.5577 Transcript_3390/m.5577 type:complete len:502 (-) Transcript_3390:43-1548(-)